MTSENDSTTITGHDAITFAERFDVALHKFADPVEGARQYLAVEEARQVAAEDPSLIWLELPGRIAVSAGEGEDYDEGWFAVVVDGMADVSWSSGVRTPCPVSDLHPVPRRS